MNTASSAEADGSGTPVLSFIPSGQCLTRAALSAQATAAAHWLIDMGLQAGDTLAVMLENRAELVVLALAARRAGLYFTPLGVHLREREIAFMLEDSGARVLVVSAATVELARRLVRPAEGRAGTALFSVDDLGDATPTVAQAVAGRPTQDAALPARPVGRDQLYSSGTTGTPRAIRKPLQAWEDRATPDPEVVAWRRAFGFDATSVYFSAAPLYHAAPLRYVLRTLDAGGRCVVQQKFLPEQALHALRDHGVTHSQWVPTMFVRLLALPEAVRDACKPLSMRVAVHSAAPCPVHVKRAMIDWWGPILHEYYAGTEGVGMTAIDSAEWLQRPGSVGQARVGSIRIVGDDGAELPADQVGLVYFADGPRFSYLNDPAKTAGVYDARGWATYGDIGHVDAQGFLYLSDRRADLILSGGVNIYPREVEDVLLTHPWVDDAAVIGIPHPELGETVKAVVKLRDAVLADGAGTVEDSLIAHCREHISHVKAPRVVELVQSLPRMENGKLMRRLLKESHRAAQSGPLQGAGPSAAPERAAQGVRT